MNQDQKQIQNFTKGDVGAATRPAGVAAPPAPSMLLSPLGWAVHTTGAAARDFLKS